MFDEIQNQEFEWNLVLGFSLIWLKTRGVNSKVLKCVLPNQEFDAKKEI